MVCMALSTTSFHMRLSRDPNTLIWVPSGSESTSCIQRCLRTAERDIRREGSSCSMRRISFSHSAKCTNTMCEQVEAQNSGLLRCGLNPGWLIFKVIETLGKNVIKLPYQTTSLCKWKQTFELKTHEALSLSIAHVYLHLTHQHTFTHTHTHLDRVCYSYTSIIRHYVELQLSFVINMWHM